jgi:hypothetical protein
MNQAKQLANTSQVPQNKGHPWVEDVAEHRREGGWLGV